MDTTVNLVPSEIFTIVTCRRNYDDASVDGSTRGQAKRISFVAVFGGCSEAQVDDTDILLSLVVLFR